MLEYLVNFYLFVTITSSFVSGDTINYDGRIAGNRTISECVNGFRSSLRNRSSELFITTSQLARQAGYPAEEHVVQTDDGYILTLHRIPGKPGAPPVFLQHGFLSSSFGWLATGKETALAFILADQGYDVWLGNFRGSPYSRCHAKYRPSNYKFWDFSWHEIGIYDLPAMITHVTRTTRQKIIYIGHSMGTTSFFVMAIERPDVASQVKVMMALAPVVFIGHAAGPIRMFAPFARELEFISRSLGKGEFLAQSSLVKRIVKLACVPSRLQKRLCSSIAFSLFDFDPRQFNVTLAPEILYHFLAGNSFRVAIHYAQEYNSKRFQYYDHGARKNLELYNSAKPPDYDLSKIAVPIGVFHSDSDVFTNPADVLQFYEQLPNKILSYKIDYPNFNHNDYIYAIDAPKLVYEKLLAVIENYK